MNHFINWIIIINALVSSSKATGLHSTTSNAAFWSFKSNQEWIRYDPITTQQIEQLKFLCHFKWLNWISYDVPVEIKINAAICYTNDPLSIHKMSLFAPAMINLCVALMKDDIIPIPNHGAIHGSWYSCIILHSKRYATTSKNIGTYL